MTYFKILVLSCILYLISTFSPEMPGPDNEWRQSLLITSQSEGRIPLCDQSEARTSRPWGHKHLGTRTIASCRSNHLPSVSSISERRYGRWIGEREGSVENVDIISESRSWCIKYKMQPWRGSHGPDCGKCIYLWREGTGLRIGREGEFQTKRIIQSRTKKLSLN